MEKIPLAARIQPNEIIEEQPGVLRVMRSDSEKANSYHVRFEDDGMPSCDCCGWKEHLVPCKHMFAIILH